MNVERISRSPEPVLDLTEAKNHTRVLFDDDDADFVNAIDAVAREAEDYGQIALINQTIRVTLPCWPRAMIFNLPIAPLLDWSTVTVTADGEAFDDYAVMTGRRPALRLSGSRPQGVIVIEYVAGFGDAAGDIPGDLRKAMLDQVSVYYDTRGAVDKQAVSLSPHFARILGRYRGVRA